MIKDQSDVNIAQDQITPRENCTYLTHGQYGLTRSESFSFGRLAFQNQAEEIFAACFVVLIGKQSRHATTQQQNSGSAKGQKSSHQGQWPAKIKKTQQQCDNQAEQHQKTQINFHDPKHQFSSSITGLQTCESSLQCKVSLPTNNAHRSVPV